MLEQYAGNAANSIERSEALPHRAGDIYVIVQELVSPEHDVDTLDADWPREPACSAKPLVMTVGPQPCLEQKGFNVEAELLTLGSMPSAKMLCCSLRAQGIGHVNLTQNRHSHAGAQATFCGE